MRRVDALQSRAFWASRAWIRRILPRELEAWNPGFRPARLPSCQPSGQERPKSAPRAAKSDPRAAKSGPRAAKSGPRVAKSTPRASKSAPRAPNSHPRATKMCPGPPQGASTRALFGAFLYFSMFFCFFPRLHVFFFVFVSCSVFFLHFW